MATYGKTAVGKSWTKGDSAPRADKVGDSGNPVPSVDRVEDSGDPVSSLRRHGS